MIDLFHHRLLMFDVLLERQVVAPGASSNYDSELAKLKQVYTHAHPTSSLHRINHHIQSSVNLPFPEKPAVEQKQLVLNWLCRYTHHEIPSLRDMIIPLRMSAIKFLMSASLHPS